MFFYIHPPTYLSKWTQWQYSNAFIIKMRNNSAHISLINSTFRKDKYTATAFLHIRCGHNNISNYIHGSCQNQPIYFPSTHLWFTCFSDDTIQSQSPHMTSHQLRREKTKKCHQSVTVWSFILSKSPPPHTHIQHTRREYKQQNRKSA